MAPKMTKVDVASKVIKIATQNELVNSLGLLTSTDTAPPTLSKMMKMLVMMKKLAAASKTRLVVVDTDVPLDDPIMESTAADRNKNNFAIQNMADIPSEIIELINKKSAHKKKDAYNNIVQKRPDGKWEFNFDSRFMKDIRLGYHQ